MLRQILNYHFNKENNMFGKKKKKATKKVAEVEVKETEVVEEVVEEAPKPAPKPQESTWKIRVS